MMRRKTVSKRKNILVNILEVEYNKHYFLIYKDNSIRPIFIDISYRILFEDTKEYATDQEYQELLTNIIMIKERSCRYDCLAQQ